MVTSSLIAVGSIVVLVETDGSVVLPDGGRVDMRSSVREALDEARHYARGEVRRAWIDNLVLQLAVEAIA